MSRNFPILAGAVALAMASHAASAQQAPVPSRAVSGQAEVPASPPKLEDRRAAFAGAPPLLKSFVRPNVQLDALLDAVSKVDSNHDGVIDDADVKAGEQGLIVSIRAAKVARYLNFDLDGDGKVTRSEIEEGLKRQGNVLFPAALKATVDQLMVADTDGDGSISYDEMRKLGPDETKLVTDNNRASLLLGLFPGEKSVPLPKVLDKVRDFFASLGFGPQHVVTEAEIREVTAPDQAPPTPPAK